MDSEREGSRTVNHTNLSAKMMKAYIIFFAVALIACAQTQSINSNKKSK